MQNTHAVGDEKTMGNEKSKLPTYEVEFIPVERRLEGRRKSSGKARRYAGVEQRRKTSRRGSVAGHKSKK